MPCADIERNESSNNGFRVHADMRFSLWSLMLLVTAVAVVMLCVRVNLLYGIWAGGMFLMLWAIDRWGWAKNDG